ncbi:dicarboxylate/amino acid:cation symporter [Thalassotalea sp. HSM 43]|uniref:dicarboxylate/amino acid:cation symporter n=1 Tax=Thalassotalea sp. HSM 43 TaxID=2552945 RepID=UPI001080DBBD|nr:dicarboxylate/amino acid:cation symporter [Thalassotalea sp. HSM 43]QBY06208.1 dicarboxylate/amino acid:cation symporter [Thalassotalea sp. HSM 43]
MKNSLSAKVFLGLVLGFIIGTMIQYVIPPSWAAAGFATEASTGLGGMFVSMIKLIVVPLVFISITCGICELKDLSSFGRLGTKTFSFYIINTIAAIALTMAIVMWLQPGVGVNLGAMAENVTLAATETPNMWQMVINIIPSNPFQAFAEGNMLQIIFMAIMTGIAIQALDKRGGPAIRSFKMANEIMMKLITLVMSLAPYGVFFLMISLGATLDSSKMLAVAGYIALVVSMFIFMFLVVYPMLVFITTGIKPVTFIKHIREQIMFSLSSASSNATIPVTMRTVTEKLGVSRSVAGFGVPLGATMNMSGAAIYTTIATIFVANAYGMPMTVEQMLPLGFTVLLLSIGAGGVPGGGIVSIGICLHTFGLPVEALAIVAAVDRICDMFCTTANVVGDTAINTIVAKSEGEIDIPMQGQAVTA